MHDLTSLPIDAACIPITIVGPIRGDVLRVQTIVFRYREIGGEILSHPENSVPQTLVLHYQEIGGILCTKQQSNGIVPI
jgi:hypothetical protein